MKSRIALAAAVVLAVALIGTARPAVGNETRTPVQASAVDVAAPASAAVSTSVAASPSSAVQATQAEKKTVQEKEKEKIKAEKEKSAVEKKIIISAKEGEKTPIEITIVEDGKTKTMVLDKPLTITQKDGQILVLSSADVGVKVLEGKPIRLEIKGGDLKIVEEGKTIKLGKGDGYTITTKGGKILAFDTAKGKTLYLRTDKDPDLKVITEGEAFKDAIKVIVESSKKGLSGQAWTVEKFGKDGAIRLGKNLAGKSFAWTSVLGGGEPRILTFGKEKELLEKVTAIREQAEAVKAKKIDFAELEKSLEKLETELKANQEKLQEIKSKLGKTNSAWTIVGKTLGDQTPGHIAAWITEDGKGSGSGKTMTVSARDDGALQLMLTGKSGREGREAYDRILEKMKKELPEGSKLLKSEFDEESGVMSFSIASPEKTKGDAGFIRKLVDSLVEELKK